MAQPKSVSIAGVTYASMRHAAKARGVSYQALQKAMKDGRALEEVTPGNPTLRGAKPAESPITIRGVEYPSQLIAAEVLGVAPATISSAKRRGALDAVGLGLRGRPKTF